MTAKYSDNLSTLVKAVLCLKNENEAMSFLCDLCTIKELKEMSSRLEIASLLKNGFVYNDIAEKTGTSTTTISRVNRALVYGDGGYELVLERLDKSDENE